MLFVFFFLLPYWTEGHCLYWSLLVGTHWTRDISIVWTLEECVYFHSQGLPWTLNMGTEQEVLMEPGSPTPDPFSLGLQTTDTSLTDGNIFSSKWGSHPELPQSWDKPHRREEIHPQAISSSYEHWKHVPALHFTCQTGYIGQHKHPFSSYKIMPQDGDIREPVCLSVDQQFDFERHLVSACSPDTRHSSLRNFQLQPYYRFHQPLRSASFSNASYRPDMDFYPPSELLDMALSPPKRPSTSPEGWSYPRMRLYWPSHIYCNFYQDCKPSSFWVWKTVLANLNYVDIVFHKKRIEQSQFPVFHCFLWYYQNYSIKKTVFHSELVRHITSVEKLVKE